MSDSELYVSHSVVFGGNQSPFEKADYVVVGVPFDGTSTYRKGAKFAPLAIREASLNIETYSFRSKIDLEELRFHDLGDLHISNDVEKTLARLERVERDLRAKGKTSILVGGEHTITLGALRGLDGVDTAIISLDAHLDLRNRYMGLTTSHTTFMRRLNEQVKPRRIIQVGTRAVCSEELTYARKAGIQYITTQEIQEKGVDTAIRSVKKAVEDCDRTYLTIDMDVLDPAFAPAVQNPEPDGLPTKAILELIFSICDSRLVGLDLVEVTPSYDSGATAIVAAKILFEALCRVERARNL